MTAAPRHVVLEQGFNVRDVGGYTATPARQVRRGLFYRSASLSDLTPADIAAMAGLDMRMVIDLRSTHERVRRPCWLPCRTWARHYDSREGDLTRALRDPSFAVADVAAVMTGV